MRESFDTEYFSSSMHPTFCEGDKRRVTKTQQSSDYPYSSGLTRPHKQIHCHTPTLSETSGAETPQPLFRVGGQQHFNAPHQWLRFPISSKSTLSTICSSKLLHRREDGLLKVQLRVVRGIHVGSNPDQRRFEGLLRPRVKHLRANRGGVGVPADEHNL